ncbi:priming glycosyltransferase [Enterococcus casseliflavus]|uniref:sugar transferase n=1 Tax=Enterococcus casseliflavus TaxID=37734 RepID=UPI0008F0530E|nr:sugar transferase [Enterococcus casseliflavus]GEB28742.1 multidrug MFS transporter [Enterococcus casseliflavus]SFD45744.1 Sugar transferase involved in LPS biosynthesis (colanic, teichoic acid) [Enterococcus casseliflavus]STP33494.1 priming glycosyltransferase [Enterococcus casseliflavus]
MEKSTTRTKSIFQSNDYIRVKRILEYSCSLVLLLVLSPTLVTLCIVIKISDWKAPIIYRQIRVGKNEKTFMMYKFRTMVPDADQLLGQYLHKNEIDGAMFKLKKDPRVTRVGRFLRKTSLDELPQLINVLKGEMALIGPRPPLEREVAIYTEKEKIRLSITPGCSGLWQVSGRSELSFQEMVLLDLYYIENMSLWLDLKIFLKTIGVVILPKGAF